MARGDAGDLGVQQGAGSWTLCCTPSVSVEHPFLGGTVGTGWQRRWRGRGAAGGGGMLVGEEGLKARGR